MTFIHHNQRKKQYINSNHQSQSYYQLELQKVSIWQVPMADPKFKNITKFSLCCYQIDDDQQNDYHVPNSNKKLMLTPDTESNIKFEPFMRNANVKIYKLLEDLYENAKDITDILPILCQKRVNPQIAQILTERDDLQYYVPQLVTFMTIQCNLENEELNMLMVRACMTDFYFAHSVYFYLQSLSQTEDGESIPNVINYIENVFLPKMKIYELKHLSGHELTRAMIGRKSTHTQDYKMIEQIESKEINNDQQYGEKYGTLKYPNPFPQYPKTVQKVRIRPYNFNVQGGFMQTPEFWMDLIRVGEKLCLSESSYRNQTLSLLIKQQINTKLPATVYIPFFTQMTRMYTILNVWEGRVFSTKQRAPFSIWIEIYREEEEQMKEILEDIEEEELEEKTTKKKKKSQNKNILKKLYDSLSKPFTIADGKNTLKVIQKVEDTKQALQKTKKKNSHKSFYERHSNEDGKKPISLFEIYDNKSQGSLRSSENVHIDSEPEQILEKPEPLSEKIFPQSSEDIINEIKKKSIYRNLKSWRLMHLMIKTGDDLRQQQFAMQLIGKFQYIFQKQKVECILKPYQVISLGPNYGIIEMLNDVTTLDSLFRKLGPMSMTLNHFFERNWKDNLLSAKTNFLRSLAGYSLVTYFLQVKDRHNGNIMLHRDGSIIHIDFGFFLSNAPGKGVQLQKNCPFKLLTAYVDVLGSTHSQMFFQFRRLFYKGFSAILKNKGMILSLVKMMYKSHGDMMNCFIKGEKAIQQLEKRLNPEGNVESFCYNLINNSLDNWRAKWYDKFQYFLQKIYY